MLLCCVGCGAYNQAQIHHEIPGDAALRSEQCREVSYVDAYPENWEHALSQRAVSQRALASR